VAVRLPKEQPLRILREVSQPALASSESLLLVEPQLMKVETLAVRVAPEIKLVAMQQGGGAVVTAGTVTAGVTVPVQASPRRQF